MQKHILFIGLYFLLLTIHVSGNHCHKNVDAFMKKIFKGVKLSLDRDDILALTDMKKGSCASASTKRAYFSAFFTNNTNVSTLKAREPVKFNDVITNEGGGYDNATGEFTAPRNGAYAFFLDFLVYPGSKIFLELQKNGAFFARNVAHNSHLDVASKSTILNMAKGDKVRVVFLSGSGQILGSGRYTGFSAFSL